MAQANLAQIYPCSPTTERGYSSSLHTFRDKLIWCTGNSVVWAGIENLASGNAYYGHTSKTTCAKYAHHGNQVVSGDASGKVKVWWMDNPEHPIKVELDAFQGNVRDLCWGDNSQKVLAVGESATPAKVFMADSGNSVGDLQGHPKTVLAGDFKPNRPFRLATVGEDFQVNFYEGPPFRFKKTEYVHSNFVNDVKFSPDGSKFITCGNDKKIFLFDGPTGQLQRELIYENGHSGSILRLQWLDNDTFISCGMDKRVLVCSLDSVQKEFIIGADIQKAQVGMALINGQTLVTLSLDGTFNIWDEYRSDAPSRTVYQHMKPPNSIQYARSRQMIFTSDYTGAVVGRQEGLEASGPLYSHRTHLITVKLSYDETKLASIETGNTLIVYENENFTNVQLPQEPIDVAWHSDSQQLAVITHSSKAYLYIDQQLEEHDLPGNALQIVHGASFWILAFDDMSVKYTQDFQQYNSFPTQNTAKITSLSVSPNNQLLAATDSNRRICLWNLQTLEPVANNWTYHSAMITSSCWAPDSNHLATCSLDNNVMLWKLDRTPPIVNIKFAHAGGANSVAIGRWSETEGEIISAGADYCMKTWRVSLD